MTANLLIDVDSKIPNLALMKISAHLKAKGEEVFLNASPVDPDRVWISCIFTWNRGTALGCESLWRCLGKEVHIGGSGINHLNNLPGEIENTIPDFHLYHDDRAVGFAQRGCNRKCEFCIVPKKEGRLVDNGYWPVSEWIPEKFNKVLLLDNNIAQSPHHDAIFQDCRDHGLKLCVTQGYDVRCLTPERATFLKDDKPWSVRFTERRIYIAWDYLQIEPQVRRGIKMLLDAGFRPAEIMCYMIVGFNSTFEQDFYRFRVLAEEFRVDPFVMVYENRRDIPQIRHFARWVNRRIYKACSWAEYRNKGQEVVEAEVWGPA